MEFVRQRRTLLLALSAAVVFVITYLLIMPAMTLDEQEAARQGGIDVAIEEQAGDAEAGDATDSSEAVAADEAAGSGETAEQTEPADASAKAGQLSAEGKGYSVSAEFGAGADLPLGTELTAEEITRDDEDYQAWHDEALKALQETKGGEQIAELKFAKFYDITLAADGGEVQPAAPVDVTISYDKPMKAADADHVRIVHFGVDEKGALVPEVLKAKDVDAQINGKGRMTETAFKAESFSVYGVVYTVDFEYTDEESGKTYQYSIPGGDKIRLSELFKALGIKTQVKDVTDVKFSDESLVKVTKNLFGYDWTLESLGAFKSEETLTVKLADGNELVVRVTDASYEMRDAVKSATMDGQSGSTWTVKEGEEYTVHLSFEETPSVVQFPTTSNTLSYQLPANFKPQGNLTNTPITLTYTEASVVKTLTGCTFSVDESGLVTINLTDEAREKLAESGDGRINIDIKGIFTQSNEHTDFGGGNEKNIIVDDSKDVSVNKTGEYKSEDNKVHYRVTVKADGALTNVNVKDVISGTALQMDQGSVKVTGNSSTPTGGPTSNGIDMTFPSMKNGETITIEYTASVDWGVIGDGKGTVEQTGNTVKVKPRETEEKTKETNLENRITYNPLAKSAGTVQNTADPDTKIVPWTITVNALGLKNMKNTTITDHNNSSDVMHYAGAGIRIEKFSVNADGSTTSQGASNISWEDLGIDPETDNSWSYKIEDDGNYKYVITYSTEVDVSGKNGVSYVSNNVKDQNGDNISSGTGVPPGSSKIGIDKVFEAANKEKMTWTVYMDVPATGLDKAILVDTLPSSGRYRDTLDVESLAVEGLENGESYALSQSRGKFTLTFYKDENQSEAGLTGTGKARRIRVTFATNNDPEWIAANRDAEHENRAEFTGDNATVTDSDRGKIGRTGLEKTAYKNARKATRNGQSILVFEYAIDLYGVTEDDLKGGLTITDDYDETYLQFLNISDGANYNGLDTWWVQRFQNGYSNSDHNVPIIVPQDNGGKLTFTVQKTDLPLDNGALYPRYQLKYYMMAKDSTELLQDSLTEEDRTIHLNNTAKWGESEDTATVDYSYPGVEKRNVAPSSLQGQDNKYDPETGTTGFRIVLNPDKLELNGGNPMTMEDVFTDNLSVDYSSIKIVVEPADDVEGEQTVTYDYKGNKGIYIIPDKCKVTITYDARVIGNPSEWVTYGNTATMHGFSDKATGRAQMGGSGDGGFSINSIKLYKYSAGHMEQPLKGATFTMVDENNAPVVYPDSAEGDKAGKPITFTTGDKGYVNISLNEQEDGISLQKGITYYLKETVSPASHAINNTTYRFTISDNPNYSNYEYHSGDIMKVYDWPIMGRIVINKQIEGPSNLTQEDMQKIRFDITGTYRNGSPIKVDEWGYAIEENDLPNYSADELAQMQDFKVQITYADFTDGSYTMADLVDGIYHVKETAAALPGYNDVSTVNTTYEVNTEGDRIGDEQITGQDEATVTITDHQKYVVNYKNTYTDKTSGYDLIIKKVDANNNSKTLYGAVFKLEKKNGDEYEAVTDGSVDDKGRFTIPYDNKDTGVTLSGLKPGDYRITEIQAPTNYKAIGDGIIEFTIDQDGNVTTTKGASSVDYNADSKTYSVKNETKHSYTITKVDGANVSLKLPGAVFGVWKSSYTGSGDVSEAMNADAAVTSEPLWTYTTDQKGRFEIQKEDHPFEENTIYYFKEITAPQGYELPEKPALNYFFFSFNGTAPTVMKPVDLGTASRSQTITNELPNLEVNKVWKNLKGDNLNKQDIDVDAIDFVVYQKATVKNAEGEVVSEGEETRFPDAETSYTIEYADGQWKPVSIPNAPAMGQDKDGNNIYYSYRIEEETPEGWVSKVEMTDSGREATITNTPEPMEITVKKKWDAPSFLDQGDQNTFAEFKVYRDNGAGGREVVVVNGQQANQLNNANHFQMTFEVEAGYTYYVEETRCQLQNKTTGFDISYTVNGVESDDGGINEAGTVEITNTYKEPYLQIVKDWQTETEHSDFEIWLNIYRRNITQGGDWELWYGQGKNQDKAKLDYRNGWKLSFEGDNLQTNGDEYEYYVTEYEVKGGSTGWKNVVDNYYISYSATMDNPLQRQGTIVVTNSDKHDGEITVEKKWKKKNGHDMNENKVPNEVEVILQRAEAELLGKTVRLKATLTKENGEQVVKEKSLTVKEGTDVTWEVTGNYAIAGNDEGGKGWHCNQDFELINSGYYQAGIKGSLNVTEDTDIIVTVSGGNAATIDAAFTGDYESPEIGTPGEFSDVPGTEQTLKKPNWTYTWENLKTDAKDGKAYVYSVREISIDGRTPSQEGFVSTVDPAQGLQKGTVTLTNTEVQKGSLKITKKVTVNGKPTDTQKADGDYTFRIEDSEGKRVKTVTISIRNGVAVTEEVKNLKEGTYTITETASTNLNVAIDPEPKTVVVTGDKSGDQVPETGIVTVTNNCEEGTDFGFEKKWIDQSAQECAWDQDIQITVNRKTNSGTDANFALSYNISKQSVMGASESGTAEYTSTQGVESDPKLKLTVSTETTPATYHFKLEGLPSANDAGEEYTYFATETNDQLAGYLAPTYSNTSAPTGTDAAYNEGTIINQQEGGPELPASGGIGTTWIYLLGVILLLGCSTTLIARRRAKE